MIFGAIFAILCGKVLFYELHIRLAFLDTTDSFVVRHERNFSDCCCVLHVCLPFLMFWIIIAAGRFFYGFGLLNSHGLDSVWLADLIALLRWMMAWEGLGNGHGLDSV